MGSTFKIRDGVLYLFLPLGKYYMSDYTHALAELPTLIQDRSSYRVEQLYRDQPQADTYLFSKSKLFNCCANPGDDKCMCQNQVNLNRMDACGSALWFHRYTPNSGSHRVIFHGEYREEPFVIAMEEIESELLCQYDYDHIYVGYFSESGRQMIENFGSTSFVIMFLEGAIYSVTGLVHLMMTEYYAGRAPSDASDSHDPISEVIWKDRFKSGILPAQEILDQGCRLTEAARKCFLFEYANPEMAPSPPDFGMPGSQRFTPSSFRRRLSAPSDLYSLGPFSK